MAYTKIRPAISKIWVLEDRDAIRTNTQEVIALTKTLLSSVAPSYRDKLQALSFAANPNELLSENAKFVATLDVRTVSLLFREIQRKSILRFCMMKEPEFPAYLASIIDLFAKTHFRKHLSIQLASARHLHGIANGIVKHLWNVSCLGFSLTKDPAIRVGLSRAGFYHDITLHGRHLIADPHHPHTAAALARHLHEPEIVINAIVKHLLLNVFRERLLSSSRVSRRLVLFDSLAATSERILSIAVKTRESLFGATS